MRYSLGTSSRRERLGLVMCIFVVNSAATRLAASEGCPDPGEEQVAAVALAGTKARQGAGWVPICGGGSGSGAQSSSVGH